MADIQTAGRRKISNVTYMLSPPHKKKAFPARILRASLRTSECTHLTGQQGSYLSTNDQAYGLEPLCFGHAVEIGLLKGSVKHLPASHGK